MKKAFALMVIAAVFFFVGRNQPNLKSSLKKVSEPDHQTEPSTKVSEAPRSQNTEATSTQPQVAQTEPQPTFEQILNASHDTELFEALYSSDFKVQWRTHLATLKQRLFSQLPKPTDDPTLYEKEFTARLGILKALGNLEHEENNPQLKEFLQSYIEFAGNKQSPQPWLLQREAAHSLTQNHDLQEQEIQTTATNLDPRARNTATRSDRQIIERTLAGDE